MEEEEKHIDLRNRHHSSQRLSEVLMQILKENNMGRQMLEHKAIDLWGVLTGPTVVSVTRSIYVKNGVIFVILDSSIVRAELLMMKGKMLDNLNKMLGEDVITDIVIR